MEQTGGFHSDCFPEKGTFVYNLCLLEHMQILKGFVSSQCEDLQSVHLYLPFFLLQAFLEI